MHHGPLKEERPLVLTIAGYVPIITKKICDLNTCSCEWTSPFMRLMHLLQNHLEYTDNRHRMSMVRMLIGTFSKAKVIPHFLTFANVSLSLTAKLCMFSRPKTPVRPNSLCGISVYFDVSKISKYRFKTHYLTLTENPIFFHLRAPITSTCSILAACHISFKSLAWRGLLKETIVFLRL